MKIDFKKSGGLVPAIVQDADTGKVLMLGYMNAEAFEKTQESKLATFYSRSRQEIWVKGQTSGNRLYVKEILVDCDRDAILVKAVPTGPVCHTGDDTCFGESNTAGKVEFLNQLADTIRERRENPMDASYTSSLFEAGKNRIVQKVGEEMVELIIEAKDNNQEKFKEEAADLIYHFLVLLEEMKLSLNDVVDVLKARSR